MTTLYIDRKNLELRTEANTLAFYSQGNKISTMPLHIIERLCIKSDLQISARTLGKLGEQGIGIIVLTGPKQQATLLMPNARQDALRRIAQAHSAQNEHFCLMRAKAWITEKIRRQHQHLQKRSQEPHIARNTLHHELAQLETSLKRIENINQIPSLRGLEGSAANTYFTGLAKYLPASLNFTGRNRNPPRDPYNAILSLSYTLLHFEMVRQIHLIGLDPYIGFYHGPSHGRESLACDLIEPLRPLIDDWAIEQLHNRTLRPEDFHNKNNACQLGKAGRARYYPAFETAARTWRKTMREQCTQLLQALGRTTLNTPQTRQNSQPDIFDPKEIIYLRNIEDELS